MKTKQRALLGKEYISLRKYYYDLWSEVSKQHKNKKTIQKEVSDRMFSNMYQYFLNTKKAQKLYEEESILRNYHSEAIKQFIGKHELPQPYMKIMSWPESKFEEWGCKIFEEKPGLVSKRINVLRK